MFSFPAHLLVGAAIAYLFGFSMLWGALGGMAPDLDYFTPWHRGPFHSFIFAAITGFFVYVLTRSEKKSLGFTAGFIAHVLADWFNYEGVMLLWPFTGIFGLNCVGWDDPVANTVLVILSVFLIIFLKKRRENKGWLETIKNLPLIKHINTLKTKVNY